MNSKMNLENEFSDTKNKKNIMSKLKSRFAMKKSMAEMFYSYDHMGQSIGKLSDPSSHKICRSYINEKYRDSVKESKVSSDNKKRRPPPPPKGDMIKLYFDKSSESKSIDLEIPLAPYHSIGLPNTVYYHFWQHNVECPPDDIYDIYQDDLYYQDRLSSNVTRLKDNEVQPIRKVIQPRDSVLEDGEYPYAQIDKGGKKIVEQEEIDNSSIDSVESDQSDIYCKFNIDHRENQSISDQQLEETISNNGVNKRPEKYFPDFTSGEISLFNDNITKPKQSISDSVNSLPVHSKRHEPLLTKSSKETNKTTSSEPVNIETPITVRVPPVKSIINREPITFERKDIHSPKVVFQNQQNSDDRKSFETYEHFLVLQNSACKDEVLETKSLLRNSIEIMKKKKLVAPPKPSQKPTNLIGDGTYQNAFIKSEKQKESLCFSTKL